VDVETGKELKKFETAAADYYVEPEDTGFRTGLRDSTLSHNRIAVAPDLSCVAYLRADLGLGIAPLAAGATPQAAGLPKDWRTSRLWFSPDGKNLFATNWGGAIARIDPATGKLIATFRGHNNGIGQWHFDPAGKVMTTTGQDGIIARWDLTTNKEIPLATGGYKSAVRGVFAGNRVVVGDRAGNIDVYDTRGKLLHELPRRADGGDWYTFALAPDNRTLVATRPDGVIVWWDLVADKELATMKLPGPVPDQMFRSIQHIGFTPDGRRLVCSKQDGNLFAVDVEAKKVLWQLGPPTDKDYDAAVTMSVSADGRYAARGLRRGVRTGDWGYGLQVVEVATGRPVNMVDVSEPKGPHGLPDLGDGHYTPDGRFLVLASRNGHIQVRHADTLAEISSWMAGSRHGLTMNVSPDGRTVLTGDDTGAIKLWELLTGKLVAGFTGHRGYVDSVAASADGRFLVTGGHDQVAFVWDLKPAAPAPAKAVERLAGDDAAAAREAIWALAADPDGPNRLRDRIKPADEPRAETLRGCVADLDDPTFARREAAMAALTKAGVLAEPAIRKALAGTPTAEARERLNKVLAGIDHKPTREDVIHSRAVHALELANTDAARKVLTEWAAGLDGAWLTIDARLALRRLGGPR
jgi:WD40 repeat protein